MALAEHRILTRALIAGALVLTVGLSGCGRKSALDPPPSASAYSDGTYADKTAGTADADATPPKPDKPNRPFFLDRLL